MSNTNYKAVGSQIRSFLFMIPGALCEIVHVFFLQEHAQIHIGVIDQEVDVAEGGLKKEQETDKSGCRSMPSSNL